MLLPLETWNIDALVDMVLLLLFHFQLQVIWRGVVWLVLLPLLPRITYGDFPVRPELCLWRQRHGLAQEGLHQAVSILLGSGNGAAVIEVPLGGGRGGWHLGDVALVVPLQGG